MKATYLKPVTEVVVISSQAILTSASGGSTGPFFEDGGDTQSNNITEAGSRSGAIWDED